MSSIFWVVINADTYFTWIFFVNQCKLTPQFNYSWLKRLSIISSPIIVVLRMGLIFLTPVELWQTSENGYYLKQLYEVNKIRRCIFAPSPEKKFTKKTLDGFLKWVRLIMIIMGRDLWKIPPPPPGYGTEKVNIPIAPQLESKFNSEVKISSRMEIYVNIVKVAAWLT